MENIKRIWPKWEAVEVIGKGGFGTVYKAKREKLGEVTWGAIKVVKIPNDDTELKEMTSSGFNKEQIQAYYQSSVQSMISEIRLMEKMKSASHIVGIEDFEVEENPSGIGWTVYIRMELLTNLTDYLSNRKVTVDEVKKMALHILTALEFCHNQNLVHRDIKPGNIFVSSFGEYKLGDFGISREVEKTNATMSQKGTKSYMAPEMIRMAKYGRNVDLYALGLTMYELLNHGRMPFLPPFPELYYPSDREEAMIKRLTGEVFPEIEGIGELNTIIQKACHYDPVLRYQTATEMKNDLLGIGNIKEKEVIIEKDNKDDVTVAGDFLFDNGEEKSEIMIEDIQKNDEKTMGLFSESNFLFDDTTGISKNKNDLGVTGLRDALLGIEKVKESNVKDYYVMVGEEKAYLAFTNGYYGQNIGVICRSNDPGLLEVKSLYEHYLKTKDVYLLEEMVRYDPSAPLYLLLGDAYMKINKEEAYRCYKMAYELDHQDARVLKRFALMAYERGEYELAMTVIKRAVENVQNELCSGDSRVIKNIYFIQALIAQKLNDEPLAIRSISNIYKTHYTTVAHGWSDYSNRFYDISKMYHESSQQQYIHDLYVKDNMGNLPEIVVGAIKFNIGDQLFANLCQENIHFMKGFHPNNWGRVLDKYGIDYETIYFYHSSFGEKYLFGKYGIYHENKKGLGYIDYYRLPLFYLYPSGISHLLLRIWEDRYTGKNSKEPLTIQANVPVFESLCHLRGKLIEERTTPTNMSIDSLGLYVGTDKKLRRANILTVKALIENQEKLPNIIKNPNDYLQLFAVLSQL